MASTPSSSRSIGYRSFSTIPRLSSLSFASTLRGLHAHVGQRERLYRRLVSRFSRHLSASPDHDHMHPPHRVSANLQCLALSPHDRRVLLGGTSRGTLIVWQLGSGMQGHEEEECPEEEEAEEYAVEEHEDDGARKRRRRQRLAVRASGVSLAVQFRSFGHVGAMLDLAAVDDLVMGKGADGYESECGGAASEGGGAGGHGDELVAFSCGEDGSVGQWLLGTAPASSVILHQVTCHAHTTAALSCAPLSRDLVASVGLDQRLVLWQPSRSRQPVWCARGSAPLLSVRAVPSTISSSPNQLILGTAREAMLVDLRLGGAGGGEERDLDRMVVQRYFQPSSVVDASTAPRVLHPPSGRRFRPFCGHHPKERLRWALPFMDGTGRVASVSDTSVKLWSAGGGGIRTLLPCPDCTGLQAAAPVLAWGGEGLVGSCHQGALAFWGTRRGDEHVAEPQRVVQVSQYGLQALAVDASGTRLAVADAAGDVRVVDATW